MLAPFVKVTFREQLMANVLNSYLIVFQDFTSLGCMFTINKSEELRRNVCPRLKVAGYFVVLWPVYVRLMQCIRRFYDDPNQNRLQAYNALKYVVILTMRFFNGLYRVTGNH